MADLSFLYDDSTLGFVDASVEVRHKQRASTSLHMSQIGDPCARKLWMTYHAGFVHRPDARMIRLFQMGDIIERRVLRDLKLAGLTVTGRRRVFSDFNKRFRGRPDGVIRGLKESSREHILEIKSCNDKSFNLFLKHGVKGHPDVGEKYYAQAQMMMHYAELERALFVIENKNTSARYQERVRIEPSLVASLREKARAIIEAEYPPDGISSRPDFWLCRFCPLNNEDYCRNAWKGDAPF